MEKSIFLGCIMKNFRNTFEQLLKMNSYSLTKKVKNKFLLKEMNDLNNHHNKNCPQYKKIMTLYNISKIKRIDDQLIINESLILRNRTEDSEGRKLKRSRRSRCWW